MVRRQQPVDGVALAFHLLTEAERECLRLVHRGYSSKEIGALRNVRSDRIDKIIISARGKLGNVARREAARLLVAHEAQQTEIGAGEDPPATAGLTPTQKSGTQPLGLDPSPLPASSGPAETPVGEASMPSSNAKQDASPPSDAASLPLASTIGQGGSTRNALDRLPRLVAILLIAAMGALTAGAALTLLSALDHLTSP